MEENQPKIGKFSLNYGLILGLISVVYGVMLYSMEAHTTQDTSTQVISIVLMIAITLWGIYNFKKANNGYLTIGEALKLGAGIALVGGIIGVIYLLVLSNVLDPDFAAKATENRLAESAANGDLTPQQLAQQREMGIKYFWIGYPFILIINIIIGLVIGLIGGLIFKKQKPAY
jgi:hypothetical protein